MVVDEIGDAVSEMAIFKSKDATLDAQMPTRSLGWFVGNFAG